MGTAGVATGWLANLRGRFIVFDGPDGCGKTTQLHRFAAAARHAGVDVCQVREPGGTPVGEQVRAVLLDPANTDMDLRCEMLLYMASRAQLVTECIDPALREGRLVLADRFISSTLAYQGAAGGLDPADIRAVGRIAVRDRWPDLVVVFDVDPQTAARRLIGGAAPGAGRKKYAAGLGEPSLFADRIEVRGDRVQHAVRQSFKQQAEDDPDHYEVVDARGDADAVFEALTAVLRRRFAPA